MGHQVCLARGPRWPGFFYPTLDLWLDVGHPEKGDVRLEAGAVPEALTAVDCSLTPLLPWGVWAVVSAHHTAGHRVEVGWEDCQDQTLWRGGRR